MTDKEIDEALKALEELKKEALGECELNDYGREGYVSTIRAALERQRSLQKRLAKEPKI